MRKPSYTVVSSSLLALALFGLAMEALRGRIPEPPPNRLQYEASEFLVQGSRSEVDWRPLHASAFAEARRTGRPILLLIGAPWSKLARDADATIFSDREVVSFLNRYMVCIRIDSQTDPKWLTAFLPLRRPRVPMLVGFQVWFLTPEGQLFHDAGAIGTTLPNDPDSFGELLVTAREELRAIRSGSASVTIPGSEQQQDKAFLTSSLAPGELDETALAREAMEVVRLGAGGRARFGRIGHAPQVLQFLLLSGRHQEFRAAADALLHSPLVDWLDGGFFRSCSAAVPRSVEFDKHAIENAQLMSVLARGGQLLEEPIYRYAAERTFDCLSRYFVHNGLVVGAQSVRSGSQGRSPRYSFKPIDLRRILTAEERRVAQENLNLRVEVNRTMSVWADDPSRLLNPESPLSRVVEKLRADRSVEASYSGRRQVDVHGYVVARMLECARLWGDSERLLLADELFGRLEWFLAGDDVRHTLQPGVSDVPYLGDYLAFADAALQSYLAFGRADMLQKGMRVLKRARFLFETGSPGVWYLAFGGRDSLGPQDVDVPEILDTVRESCTSQAIRLCSAYGRLLRDSSVRQSAETAVAQNAELASRVGLESAGVFCSSLKVLDDAFILVSGPQSAQIASRIYRAVPTRLVAAASGAVAEQIPFDKEGIFLIQEGRFGEPLTEQEAIRRLSPTFRGGP